MPISETLSGMLTETSDVQSQNAPLPISFTLSGMLTETRVLQPLNAI